MSYSKRTTIIFIIVVILIATFASLRENNTALEERLEEERLDYLVKIDELKEEIRKLENYCCEYEELIDELYDEIEKQAVEYYGDYERMIFTDNHICCTLKNDGYYHQLYYCFDVDAEIDNIYLKDKNLPQGYFPCPKCY